VSAGELQQQLSSDELIDAWESGWSTKDPDAFSKCCSERLHYEDPIVSEPLEDLPALIAHAERLWAAFPDARLEKLGPRIADGRYIAAPSKLLATHREPIAGLPATGRFVVVPCIFYCELQRGKLFRVRTFFDLYETAMQLGVLPPRGSLSERAMLMLRGFGLRAPS
jgi:steroid delta-isomerase-like uncharacterized protein